MKKFLITILCSLLMITLFGCSNGNQKNEDVDSSQDITEIIEENVDTNDDENEKIKVLICTVVLIIPLFTSLF
ncbi:MAG: hypothetical protein MSA78_04425 [Solobacterium sp.]|nr:hypothetical protein [Solobacterium sp.]